MQIDVPSFNSAVPDSIKNEMENLKKEGASKIIGFPLLLTGDYHPKDGFKRTEELWFKNEILR